MSTFPKHSRAFTRITSLEQNMVVTIPEAAQMSPQGRIRDLHPGEWGFGQWFSVLSDYTSRILTVDTEDLVYDGSIDLGTFKKYAAIMRAASFLAYNGMPTYIADLRRVVGLTARNRDSGFREGYDIDNGAFRVQRERFGAQVLTAAVFNEFGENHYVGPEDLVQDAESLVLQVDTLHEKVKNTSGSVPQSELQKLYNAQEPTPVQQKTD